MHRLARRSEDVRGRGELRVFPRRDWAGVHLKALRRLGLPHRGEGDLRVEGGGVISVIPFRQHELLGGGRKIRPESPFVHPS